MIWRPDVRAADERLGRLGLLRSWTQVPCALAIAWTLTGPPASVLVRGVAGQAEGVVR